MNEAETPKPDADTLIHRVLVSRLFGRYDYTLNFGQALQSQSRQFAILHGPNGSGKTTVLKVIFHLLSPALTAGHRTRLGRIPFESIVLDLTDQSRVRAFRKKPEHSDYEIGISLKGAAEEIFGISMSKEGANWPEEQRDRCLTLLRLLDIQISYLTDSRHLYTSDDESREEDIGRRRKSEATELLEWTTLVMKGHSGPPDVLKEAVERFNKWALREASQSANIGEGDAHRIYTDIVSQIVGAGRLVEGSAAETTDLTSDLLSLRDTSVELATLGISPEFQVMKIIDLLDHASEEGRTLARRVLAPYLNSIRAKFRAQETLKRLLDTFLSGFEAFYQHKQVCFNLHDGLTIRLDQGRGPLEPSHLSSGERHLLLLFCNLISSRGRRNLILIDEPELSLNGRWQRQLVSSLQRIIAGTPTQMVLATHSVEIMAHHPDNVCYLDET